MQWLPALPDLLTRVRKAGGRFMVCPVCFNAKQLDKGDLLANAELSGTLDCGSGSATRSPLPQLLTRLASAMPCRTKETQDDRTGRCIRTSRAASVEAGRFDFGELRVRRAPHEATRD